MKLATVTALCPFMSVSSFYLGTVNIVEFCLMRLLDFLLLKIILWFWVKSMIHLVQKKLAPNIVFTTNVPLLLMSLNVQ